MHESEKWKWSRSVLSDPQQPHELQPSRLLSPRDFPGKSTGVECHRLLRKRGRGAIKGPISSINSVSIFLLLGPEETLENSASPGARPHRPSFGQLPQLTKWLSLRQHYMHATVFKCFSHTTRPPLGHQPQLQAALEGNTTRPWPNGKRRDIRPVLATSGSDVGLSTCKMAAHHRQNTAGRRKVQVGKASSLTSRAWLAALVPHPASRCLGPRSARVAAWGKQDGARLAARGGAAALTAWRRGGGRPAGPAEAQSPDPWTRSWELGVVGQPLSRRLVLAV